MSGRNTPNSYISKTQPDIDTNPQSPPPQIENYVQNVSFKTRTGQYASRKQEKKNQDIYFAVEDFCNI